MRFLIVWLMPIVAWGQLTFNDLPFIASATGAGFREGFEGVGAPSGWVSSGTVDYDDTSAPIQDTESLKITAGSAYKDFTSANDVWISFKITWNFTESGFAQVALIADGASATGVEVYIYGGGVYLVVFGTEDTTFSCGEGMSGSQTVWIHYQKVGTTRLWFQNNGSTTFQESCIDSIVTPMPGTATAVNRITFYGSVADGSLLVDNLVVSDSALGSNP